LGREWAGVRLTGLNPLQSDPSASLEVLFLSKAEKLKNDLNNTYYGRLPCGDPCGPEDGEIKAKMGYLASSLERLEEAIANEDEVQWRGDYPPCSVGEVLDDLEKGVDLLRKTLMDRGWVAPDRSDDPAAPRGAAPEQGAPDQGRDTQSKKVWIKPARALEIGQALGQKLELPMLSKSKKKDEFETRSPPEGSRWKYEIEIGSFVRWLERRRENTGSSDAVS
jgi:hypothetical protein